VRDVEAGAVRIGVDGNRDDSQFAAGANDAQGNFSTIGDENFFDFFIQTLSVLECAKSRECDCADI